MFKRCQMKIKIMVLAVFLCFLLFPAAVFSSDITFGKNNEMYVDGKLFMPVHAWAANMKDADRLQKMGINVLYGIDNTALAWKDISPESLEFTKKTLDELAKRKMYGILFIHAWWDEDLKRRGTMKEPGELIKMFKDHPALLGWHISTEADMGMGKKEKTWKPKQAGTPQDLEMKYKTVKEADPKHPVVLMVSGGQTLAKDRNFGWTLPTPEDWYFSAARWCDILYVDTFPVCSNYVKDLKMVADSVDKIKKYSKGVKSLWSASDAGDRKRWSKNAPAPSGKQIKCELWMSLIHGAHGLGFDYTGFNPFASIRIDPQAEELLAAAVKEVQTLKEPLLLGETAAEVKVISNGQGKVDLLAKRYNNKLYIFCVNVEAEKCSAEVTNTGGKSAEAVNEGRTVPLKAGSFVDTFEAYAVHLYIVE